MALSGISPVAQYNIAVKDEQKASDTYIKTDTVSKRYVDDFRAKSSSITSTNELMKDYSANQVVLGAYNLKTVSTQPALETKLLNENAHNAQSTAAKSHNATWMSFADDFYKLSTTDITMEELPELDKTTQYLDNNFNVNSDFIDQTIQQYKFNKYEDEQLLKGGVGKAVYFTRQFNDGNVRNIDDILKNSKLLDVVKGAYNIDSESFDVMSFKDQKAFLSRKMDMSSFTGQNGTISSSKVESVARDYINKISGGNVSESYIEQYNDVIKNEKSKSDGYFMGNSTVTNMINDFQKTGTSIKTINDLMSNISANKIILGSFELDDLISDPEQEKLLLRENPYYSGSYVAQNNETNNSSNERSFAGSFYNIKTTKGTMDMMKNPNTTSTKLSGDIILSQEFVDKTAQAYELRQYETSKDLNKSGVGNALYFTRTMEKGNIKDVNSLMSDATLLKVVEAVNGYNPDDIGSLDFKQQQNIIKRIFNVNDFTKPNPNPTAADGSDDRIPDTEKIQKYAQRYLAMVQIHPEWNSVDQPASMLDLFGGSSEEDGILALFA